MRIIGFCFLIALLAACVSPFDKNAKGAKDAVTPIAGDVIQTTTLAPPGGAGAVAAGSAASVVDDPAPQPNIGETEAAVAPAVGAPAPFKGKATYSEGAECLRKGGQWVAAGQTGAMACVRVTKDGGKQCSSKDDCLGECLARSRSCSPIAPLFGCNEILTEGGLAVMQCLE